jgi:oligopeptide transport system substrate-binding protein
MLYPIKNARDIVLGKKSSETLGVRTNGPTTLIIELDEPTPYFLSLLTHSTTYAAHRPSVEGFGARFTRPGNLVGNGAFKLEEWRVQSHIKLVRNTEYWDNKNTTLEEVYYYPLDDVNSSFKRYRAQELDFTETVLAEQLPWIRQCLPDDLKISPYFGSYYYGFNNTRPPFKNKPKLRTALSMAVDRSVITDIILGAGQIPAYSLVPSVKTFKTVPTNWSQWTQEQRNQEAQKLYRASGFSKENPLEVEILYNTSDNHKRVALAIAAMWKQTLGVKTTLRNQEWKVFLETRRLKTDTQVYRAGWIGDYDDPYTFSQLLHSENEMNHPGYSSEEYDDLINLAATKNAGENRLDALRQAERVMLEDMPIIPIYFYVSQHLVKPRVSGLEGNVMDHHYSKYVRILKTEPVSNNGKP